VDRAELITPETPLAFVDIETTGGHPGVHRVIDIAVIGVTGGRVDFEWQTLVNPGVRIPFGITALTGIDDEMLVDAPPFERIAAELRSRLDGRVFVAHNVRFDYGFIRREFAAMETAWRAPTMCTVRLSRALYPEMPRHNLDAVMEHHGITIESRHRAMPDAVVLRELWRKVRAEWPAQTLQDAMDRASLRANLPAALSPDLADDLPESAGVYRFYGQSEGESAKGEVLLYIGKANILRERVLDHFRSSASDAKALRLAAQVRRIDWTETAGELGALLLEAREVREHQPLYNRQLRGGGERLTWLFADDSSAPRLVPLDAESLRSGDAFGAYRVPRDARKALESLAREHRWCLKVLGFESGAGSCVGYQVGRCGGACVGAEAPGLHLARVKLALMPQRLEPWPHEGPMLLREGSGERAQYHVIDAWQHLATVDCNDEDALLELPRASKTSGRRFDVDTYRILSRHLRDSYKLKGRFRPLRPPTPERSDESWN
jgi:DNA polymerase-3 subunit epsilon